MSAAKDDPLSGHRRCFVVRGSEADTRSVVEGWLGGLGDRSVLWVGEDAPERIESVARTRVGDVLGRAFDVVVVDAHRGFDADVLGQVHGLVWGGGALVLRRSPRGIEPVAPSRLAVIPYTAADVTHRFERHVERRVATTDLGEPTARHLAHGTAEQARIVEQLADAWREDTPSRIVLTADRGRGKSAALGLAAARTTKHAVVTAANEHAVHEVLRFAAIPFVPLADLLRTDDRPAIILVDEASQLPVPLLQRLVRRHAAHAHLAFASTVHGYEGTGRGFALRFVEWLDRKHAPVRRLELREPIRWADDDPLERSVFAALLLDCELPDPVPTDNIEFVTIDRDTLTLAQLRELFGLLVHAHYRTTPGDLHRLLDAPNLRIHAALARGHVVAANLVAEEGGLTREQCRDVASGITRLNGNALADAVVAHLGHTHAGELRMLRSVRIAVHPAWRRRGLASRLTDHVHRSDDPDLFGTMFGATTDLVAFRRSLGYEVVRVSASRGTRTGEPSVMMLRARTDDARALVHTLRRELARELPIQLDLLQADDELDLDRDLVAALARDLPEPAPIDDADAHAYAFGPRTFESCATAVIRAVERRRDDLTRLDATERAVVEARVLAHRGWLRTTTEAGLTDVRVAMRTLRIAIRKLLNRT